jgi:hypothetical protein
MKTIDVIEHARSRSPFKVKSSLLRWEPSSCSLIMRVGGQWRPAVTIFDGVLIEYAEDGDGKFGRRVDCDKYRSFITGEAKDRLHLRLQPQLPCSVEERTPNATSMLRGVVDSISPNVDQYLYWQWAFQYMLVTYCYVVRSATSESDSKLNALVASTDYSRLSQNLEALSNSVCRGNVLNYFTEATALKASLDKINSSLYSIMYRLGAAYSDEDMVRYNRPAISVERLSVDTSGDWEQFSHKPSITIVNPAMLMLHWSDLVRVLASVGITEPTPYGLTFCPDNLAALASLYDVAKLDYKEPQKWREATLGLPPLP